MSGDRLVSGIVLLQDKPQRPYKQLTFILMTLAYIHALSMMDLDAVEMQVLTSM